MVESIFEDVHLKRAQSLANYAVGAMHASCAAVHAIGAAYASIAEIKPKHGIEQIDRYLSNDGINLEALTPQWVKFVIGPRRELLLIVDWTGFQHDDQTTLCAYLATSHGRATPLAWQTYRKPRLTDGARTSAEHAFIDRLSRAIPSDIAITLLADRGFDSREFYQTLTTLGWDYVIRFRSSILVESNGETKAAKEWLPPSGRATKLVNAKVTGEKYEVGAVLVVKRSRMKCFGSAERRPHRFCHTEPV